MDNYSDKLVLRVNELFHDFEGDKYEYSHDEIFVLEPERWKKLIDICSPLFIQKRRLTFLDVGSGTGFVPQTLTSFLRREDTFICTDISERILSECRKNLEAKGTKTDFRYKKFDGVNLPAEDNSIDIVTINSTLHHIPRTEKFLAEANRILKNSGFLIIGHEPNKRFYSNQVIWTIYRILYLFYHPKSIAEILTRRGLWPNREGAVPSATDPVTERINQILSQEALITKPLTKADINKLVDFWSLQGFDIHEIGLGLPNFKLRYLETYNHLYWLFIEHHKNPVISGLNYLLGKFYPHDGKTMSVVYQKVT